MSTTCQTIITRAKAFSPLNDSLATDPVELLGRIEQFQQRLFSATASVSKDRFQTTQTLASTSGASARTVDLSSLTAPLERLLVVTVPNGIARQVDVQDQDAELSPRYIARGLSLVEIGSDWSGTSGSVSVALVYVYGPAAISTTGATTQTVTIPDTFSDLLVLPLAMYFHTKDPGRDPSEYEHLNQQFMDLWQQYGDYLVNYSGVKSRRFDIPAPSLVTKK